MTWFSLPATWRGSGLRLSLDFIPLPCGLVWGTPGAALSRWMTLGFLLLFPCSQGGGQDLLSSVFVQKQGLPDAEGPGRGGNLAATAPLGVQLWSSSCPTGGIPRRERFPFCFPSSFSSSGRVAGRGSRACVTGVEAPSCVPRAGLRGGRGADAPLWWLCAHPRRGHCCRLAVGLGAGWQSRHLPIPPS